MVESTPQGLLIQSIKRNHDHLENWLVVSLKDGRETDLSLTAARLYRGDDLKEDDAKSAVCPYLELEQRRIRKSKK